MFLTERIPGQNRLLELHGLRGPDLIGGPDPQPVLVILHQFSLERGSTGNRLPDLLPVVHQVGLGDVQRLDDVVQDGTSAIILVL